MNREIFNHFLDKHHHIQSQQLSSNRKRDNDFNLLEFIRTDEVGLSKLLAFLLDPNQLHNQGNLFLNSFLRKLNLEKFEGNYDNINIWTEYSTPDNKRHDIFIIGLKSNEVSWAISIENKLRGAADQPNQLKDYYLDLERYHPENHFVLYLPSYERLPSKESIPNWDEKTSGIGRPIKGKVWTPKDLSDWLSNLEISSDKTKFLVNDFIIFLETEILGMNQINSELLKFSLESRENKALVLDIFAIQEEFYHSLKQTLIEKLKDKFNADNLFNKEKWKLITENEKQKYELIQLVPEDYPFVIHFERTNEGMYYGFKWKNINNTDINNQYIALIQKIPKGTTSTWWAKWMWCPTTPLNLKSWDKNVWLAIESGDVAEQIWSNIRYLWDQFIKLEQNSK